MRSVRSSAMVGWMVFCWRDRQEAHDQVDHLQQLDVDSCAHRPRPAGRAVRGGPDAAMIHVILPAHLRTLAHVDDEVTLEVEGQVTQRSAETIANAGWRTGDWVNGLLQRGRQP